MRKYVCLLEVNEMKNVLIYFPERKLAPKGGPAGYLNNLRMGLGNIALDELNIDFYKDAPVEFEENQSIRSMVPKRLKEIKRAYKYANYLKRKLPIDRNLLAYDAIHFHKTEDMYLNRELLDQYKGKVILTSHTPCVPYQEIIGRLNPKDYILFKRKIDKLIEMDRYAFERADYIVFPCEEAEEPYYHTWEKYADIRISEKYQYIPTGIMGCVAKVNRDEFRRKYNIPQDAFVVSYAGRHNEIKGYGDLKVVGEQLLNEHKDIYFLIAGKEGPIYSLKNNRWIEIGWTTDPHSLIAASDIFVLPNHETYFDLILLEVLSLGIPIVMSNTGGNRYFQKFYEKGLMFYDSLPTAIDKILLIKKMTQSERANIGKDLIELFNRDFTVQKFAANYVKIITKIVNSGE